MSVVDIVPFAGIVYKSESSQIFIKIISCWCFLLLSSLRFPHVLSETEFNRLTQQDCQKSTLGRKPVCSPFDWT